MTLERAPAEGLALLSLCAAMAVAAFRLSETQMKTPMEGPRHTTLPQWRVDLDAAGADELAALPGIGPALASTIVADRQARGPFGTLKGLDLVRGVGPLILEQIRPFVLQPPQ